MRILFPCSYYKPAYIYGGPVRSVSLLCEGMVKIGAQITVLATNANGPGRVLDVPVCQPLNVGGVQVYYFPISLPLANFYPFYSPILGRACEGMVSQFDAVYIGGNWTYPVLKGGKASIRNHIPYVISPRGGLMTWPMREKGLRKRIYLELLERQIINSAAVIHTTSLLEKQQMQKWHFKPPVTTIPNGIDLTPYTILPERGNLKSLLNIPDNSTISLFVGRLHKTKRLCLTIDAFASFARGNKDAHLVIVGQDEDGSGKAAQEKVIRLGLTDQVHFTGQLSGIDLIQAYVDADMLVLISYNENFGMAAVEAMAMGLPLLLSKEVGLASDVEKANAGIVVTANLVEVGIAWKNILSNRELRKEMGKNGKQLVQERFVSENVANRMLELFVTIIGKNRQPYTYYG